jgi:hypothetical protein
VSGRWHAALGYALTDEDLDLPDPALPDVSVLLADLAAIGWTGDRIAAHARACAAAEVAWPHAIPAALRTGCGPAQLAAALGVARHALGLTALETRPPSGRRRLNPDEERLLREVPPHHGS